MDIVYLISSLAFGGAQKIAVGLAEEAKRRGHRPTILSILDENDFTARLSSSGLEYETLNGRSDSLLRSLPEVIKLRKRLVERIQCLAPDVIHTQLFIPRVLMYRMTSVSGCPVVDTQQDNSPWWHRRNLKSRLQTHVDRMFLSRTARSTAAISKSVKADVQARFQLPAESCPLIYNFMDAPPAGRVCSQSGEVRRRVLIVSRLDLHKKGLDVAITAFGRVREVLPDAVLTIVGDGPDEGLLRSLVAEEGLTDCVEFLGYQEDVYSHFSSADVLLMPSRWEGFGIVAAEAGAVGLPVVASRVGGLQEVVLHGKTGFTCRSGDVQDMAERLLSLLTDDQLHRSFSQTARASVSDRFSIGAAFDRYEELYQKALLKAG